MNHEAISQLCMAEHLPVARDAVARRLFARLQASSTSARHLADVLSSAALLAQVEGLCLAALRPHLDLTHEVVLGRRFALEHRGPAAAGDVLDVHGFVTGLGDHSVTFHVDVRTAGRAVAELTLVFVVAPRSALAARRQAAAPARHAVQLERQPGVVLS
jgi:predicted thioesterase